MTQWPSMTHLIASNIYSGTTLCAQKEASRLFTIILANLKATFIIFGRCRCCTLLGHQPYKIFQPHPSHFAALPCEVTFVQKFHFSSYNPVDKQQN